MSTLVRGREPYFKRLLGWFEEYTKIKRFWRTRTAIIDGENLFDTPAGDLASRDLMGPLTFNVYETTLAAIPAAFLGWVFRSIRHVEVPIIWPSTQNVFWRLVFTEAEKIGPAVGTTLRSFLVPTLLLVTALGASWSSLHRDDSNASTRRRCRNAFLYFDGAHGLLPQMLGSLVLIYQANSDWLETKIGWEWSFSFGMLTWFPFTVIGFWQLYVLFVQIPRLLFDLNGYAAESIGLLRPQISVRPWRKYIIGTALVGFVVVPVTYVGLQLIAGAAIILVAMVKVFLQLHFGT